MMKLTPHLSFAGQCQAAFEFYQQCLDGKIVTMLTYGNSPMASQTPLAWQDKIVHATLEAGENVLFGADVLPSQYQTPRGFHIAISTQEPEEAARIFRELAQDGTVQMPLQKTFWALRFGVLVDRFGISWEVNCGQAQ
jgi:PhnB protein